MQKIKSPEDVWRKCRLVLQFFGLCCCFALWVPALVNASTSIAQGESLESNQTDSSHTGIPASPRSEGLAEDIEAIVKKDQTGALAGSMMKTMVIGLVLSFTVAVALYLFKRSRLGGSPIYGDSTQLVCYSSKRLSTKLTVHILGVEGKKFLVLEGLNSASVCPISDVENQIITHEMAKQA